jgi:hypothetical protein
MVSSSPGLSGEYGPAADALRRQILVQPQVKVLVDHYTTKGDKILQEDLGIDKGDLIYGAIAVSLGKGIVSTKPFKKLAYRSSQGWTLRPEVEYTFKGQSNVSSELIMKWDF